MSLTIQQARPEHRRAIEAIAQEVVEHGTMFVYEDVEHVLDYWYSAGSVVYVALVEGEVAGTYSLKPNQPHRGAHVANAGYMVRAAMQGRGVGRALGEHSLKIAQDLGFRAMQFNMVVATNVAAIRLWEKLGFRTVGTLPQVFRHPSAGLVDALVMVREF